KALISACTALKRLLLWRPPSTPDPERRSIGKRRQRHLISCFYPQTTTVLRPSLESAVTGSNRASNASVRPKNPAGFQPATERYQVGTGKQALIDRTGSAVRRDALETS